MSGHLYEELARANERIEELKKLCAGCRGIWGKERDKNLQLQGDKEWLQQANEQQETIIQQLQEQVAQAHCRHRPCPRHVVVAKAFWEQLQERLAQLEGENKDLKRESAILAAANTKQASELSHFQGFLHRLQKYSEDYQKGGPEALPGPVWFEP